MFNLRPKVENPPAPHCIVTRPYPHFLQPFLPTLETMIFPLIDISSEDHLVVTLVEKDASPSNRSVRSE
jgi:hypothetical protein